MSMIESVYISIKESTPYRYHVKATQINNITT